VDISKYFHGVTSLRIRELKAYTDTVFGMDVSNQKDKEE
jgi:hypothetical protein